MGNSTSLQDTDGTDYSIPDNATGCYGKACNTPLNQITDNHISKSTNNFFSEQTSDIKAKQITKNQVNIKCEGREEDSVSHMQSTPEFLAMSTQVSKDGSSLTFCSQPGYCNQVGISAIADASQGVKIKDVTQYSPETAVTDSTNIGAVVANSTQFMDSSMFGNSQGPKNMQQLSNIQLRGQDISEQNACITNKIKSVTEQTSSDQVDLKTESRESVMTLNMACPSNKIDLHAIGDQKVSLASTIGNSAALSSAQQQGVTVDASNKDETTHHNTNLNDALDTVGGVVNHLADDVNNVIGNDVAGDMTTGWIATMILPCVGIAVILIGLGICMWVMHKHGNSSSTNNTKGDTGDQGTQVDMSGGGTINLKLTNEQLIIIIIIILLIYNIRNGV